MDFVRRLNGCEEEGQKWNKGPRVNATLYRSSTNTPFVSVICPVRHEVPKVAGRMIARFFKNNSQLTEE